MSTEADLLQDFIPIQELSQTNRSRLAAKADLIELGPRQRLDEPPQGRWIIYLLEGSLALDGNAREHTLTAGSEQARRPVFPMDWRGSQASAQSLARSRVLRIDRALFDLLLREQRVAGYEVHDTPLNDTEGTLLYHIYQAVKNGSLTLPSMPEVAMRIRDATLRPEVSLQEIARIVQIDPVVAAGILRAANSAALRGSQPADSVSEAVVRLGFESTRSLATRIAVSQIFKARTPLIRRRMHILWEHSVQVSALASVIAHRCDGLDPEHAQIAGLLHDIGCVPILLYAERHDLIHDADGIEAALKHLRTPIGLLILDYWDLDNDLSQVIQGAEDWQRRSPQTAPDHTDLIIVAQRMLAPQEDGLPTLDEMPSYQRLALGPSSREQTLEFLQAARKEIDGIKQLLMPRAA